VLFSIVAKRYTKKNRPTRGQYGEGGREGGREEGREGGLTRRDGEEEEEEEDGPGAVLHCGKNIHKDKQADEGNVGTVEGHADCYHPCYSLVASVGEGGRERGRKGGREGQCSRNRNK